MINIILFTSAALFGATHLAYVHWPSESGEAAC